MIVVETLPVRVKATLKEVLGGQPVLVGALAVGPLPCLRRDVEALEPAAHVLPLPVDEAELRQLDSLLRPPVPAEHAFENSLVNPDHEDKS